MTFNFFVFLVLAGLAGQPQNKTAKANALPAENSIVTEIEIGHYRQIRDCRPGDIEANHIYIKSGNQFSALAGDCSMQKPIEGSFNRKAGILVFASTQLEKKITMTMSGSKLVPQQGQFIDCQCQGQTQQAFLQVDWLKSTLDASIKKRPTTADLYLRGRLFQEDGNFKRAHEDFTRALRDSPEHALTYLYRGQLYHYMLFNYDRAIKDYDQALKLNKELIAVHLHRGRAQLANHNYLGAYLDFNIHQNKRKSLLSLFHRAETQLKMGYRASGCRDLRLAYQMGIQRAAVEISQHCK